MQVPIPFGGSAPPSNAWFHGPTRVFIRNGMSIGLAVFCTVHLRVSHYFTMGRHIFPKIAFPLEGSGRPSNTWYLGPTQVIKPNGISIG